MSNPSMVTFDVDEQMKTIQDHTDKVQKEVEQLISDAEATDISDATQSVDKMETEISQMLSDIELHLEHEINKINEQLQTLLPDDINK